MYSDPPLPQKVNSERKKNKKKPQRVLESLNVAARNYKTILVKNNHLSDIRFSRAGTFLNNVANWILLVNHTNTP